MHPVNTTIVALAAVALGGCVGGGETTPKAEIRPGIEQWKCGDRYDGCGFLATDCVTLTTNLRDGTGEVKFGEILEDTKFHIQGLERRWDWCLDADGRYYCAFVISVDGTARYYNFQGSDDGKAKPTDLFKCEKR